MYVADMHCDTISKIYHRRKEGETLGLYTNDLQIDLKKLQQGNYVLQNFAVFVDLKNDEDSYRCARNQIELFLEEIQKNQDKICQVRTGADIIKNQKAGRISALLTLEEGEVCQGDFNKLEEFYKAGVRMMTFTWNYDNSLGNQKGLTEKGIGFLERMESLGILPDVSHISDEAFYDVYRYSTKPFVASHSNARALCLHRRNLKDDMIRKIGERGGVIGVNYYGIFLENEPQNGVYYSKVERIADHIMHMISVGGIHCVGLGSDFDGIDRNLELTDSSKINLLIKELEKRGLNTGEIELVMYRNVLNLYQEIF